MNILEFEYLINDIRSCLYYVANRFGYTMAKEYAKYHVIGWLSYAQDPFELCCIAESVHEILFNRNKKESEVKCYE